MIYIKGWSSWMKNDLGGSNCCQLSNARGSDPIEVGIPREICKEKLPMRNLPSILLMASFLKMKSG